MCLLMMGIYTKIHIKKINIKNQVCNYYFDNLVKAKKSETKNVSIDEKNYKDLTIYIIRYIHSKSIKMFSLHYHELMGKIKEDEGLVYDYMLDKVLVKIKEIMSIGKFGDTKILIDTDDKLKTILP